jgi:hypothetical protein
MAGLVPAIQVLDYRVVEIVPSGVLGIDEPSFPRPWPVLDVMFTLDGETNVVVFFEIDEAFKLMTFCEPIDRIRTMLVDPAQKIARDANVKYAVRPVTEDVDITTGHSAIMKGVDGRDKPGHDEIGLIS